MRRGARIPFHRATPRFQGRRPFLTQAAAQRPCTVCHNSCHGPKPPPRIPRPRAEGPKSPPVRCAPAPRSSPSPAGAQAPTPLPVRHSTRGVKNSTGRNVRPKRASPAPAARRRSCTAVPAPAIPAFKATNRAALPLFPCGNPPPPATLGSGRLLRSARPPAVPSPAPRKPRWPRRAHSPCRAN